MWEESIVDMKYPPDRSFHRRHTWAKQVGPNRVRIGLDAFAVRLIGSAISVIFPQVDSLLAQNEAGCWIMDVMGPIPIRMPVSGRLVQVNRKLMESPSAIFSSSYDDGWLVEVYCEDGLEDFQQLLSSGEIRKSSEQDLDRFSTMALKYIHKGSNKVGATLPDGGEKASDLRQILGPPRYRKLVMTFL